MDSQQRKADLAQWLAGDTPGGHDERRPPPQTADFEGFIVWSYTNNCYLGQEPDEGTGEFVNRFVPEAIFAVQFDTFDEASERASELDVPAVVLFAAERRGEVIVIG